MIPLPAVFFLSCAALAYEVLLVRVLHIVHDHHFAFMILSLALLGYGAGATGLTLAQRLLLRRSKAAFAVTAVFLSWMVLLSPAGLSRISFNPLEILWNPRQIGSLAAVFLTLSLPFLAAGLGVGLAFRSEPQRAHRVYLADLAGAALGAALAVGLIHVLDVSSASRAVSVSAAIAAILSCMGKAERRNTEKDSAGIIPSLLLSFFPPVSACVLACLAIQVLVPQKALVPTPYPYKGFSYALKVPETRVLTERFGPVGWVTVLESPHVPYRSLSGWSLSCTEEPPWTPRALFVDGIGPVPLFSGEAFVLAPSFRECLMSTLPYRLARLHGEKPEGPRVLHLGLHGNWEPAIALLEGVSALDVVERHEDVARMTIHWAWGLTSKDVSNRVFVHGTDTRRFLRNRTQVYDVIHPVSLGILSGSASGAASLMEVYDATVEAFTAYLDRLSSNGFLAVLHSLSVPPQATLRFAATAKEALERRGIPHQDRHMALIHDWNTALLLVKKSMFSSKEKDFIREFCAERSFDLAYLDDMTAGDAQRFHVSGGESLYRAMKALLNQEADTFMKTYPFRIDPVTDNRPYVFHFLRWKTLRELLGTQHGRTVPLLSWGVPVILATLVQAFLAAALFLALPLALRFRTFLGRSPQTVAKTFCYFGSLGLAFLFVETVAIQKNIFVLGHSVYGFAASVGSFLLWAGLGSLASSWCVLRLEPKPYLRRRNILGVLTVFTGSMVLVWGTAWVAWAPWVQGLQDGFRWAFTLLGMAPVAFFMGMPMPLGLRALARTEMDFVPWAWAINGCASVLSALLAALGSMTFGFQAILAAGGFLYFLAALNAPSAQKEKAVGTFPTA
ncbi:MAG: hypothetical protein WHS46_07870 [Desulfosoma sp.]